MNQTPKGEARTDEHEAFEKLFPNGDNESLRLAMFAMFSEGWRAALAQSRTPEPAHERSSEDWRRLTGLWKHGARVLPHPSLSKDFYAWLAMLDAFINALSAHPAGAVAEAAQPEPADWPEPSAFDYPTARFGSRPEAVGALLDEIARVCAPVNRWYAMNEDESGYSMEFDWLPEAERWFAENPKASRGYHLVKRPYQTEAERLAARAAAILSSTASGLDANARCDETTEGREAAQRAAVKHRIGAEAGRIAIEVERAAENKDFSPQALRSAVVILLALARGGV